MDPSLGTLPYPSLKKTVISSLRMIKHYDVIKITKNYPLKIV